MNSLGEQGRNQEREQKPGEALEQRQRPPFLLERSGGCTFRAFQGPTVCQVPHSRRTTAWDQGSRGSAFRKGLHGAHIPRPGTKAPGNMPPCVLAANENFVSLPLFTFGIQPPKQGTGTLDNMSKNYFCEATSFTFA